MLKRIDKDYIKGGMWAVICILTVATFSILVSGMTSSFAAAEGLSAYFGWPGKGSGQLSATVTNTSFAQNSTTTKAVYAVYFCTKAKTTANGCAPDFAGDNKSAETLTFQTIDLVVPGKSNSQTVNLPTLSNLAGKTCGRFQVDLGLAKTNGGIIGGQVFVIGSDCSGTSQSPTSPSASPTPPAGCPYTSTQAQVQKNSNDPWGDSKTIILGESVRLGGFHNGTGRFAGDPANNYSPNTVNVEFFVTDPSGSTSQTLFGNYPLTYTPTKTGTYSFIGKTRKDATQANAGYFSENTCTDNGSIIVLGKPSPSPSPKPASPSPIFSPTPLVSPFPTIKPSPSASPSISPTPTPQAKTKLVLCKFNDTNADGVKGSDEKTISWKFNITVPGLPVHQVESHWWDFLHGGCAVVDIPVGARIRVEEESKTNWQPTALYVNNVLAAVKTAHTFDSQKDTEVNLWFLNNFVSSGGTQIASPTPSPSPGVNIQPECVSLSANPSFGGARLNTTFIAKGRDHDGIIKRIDFNFGDGQSQGIDTNGATNADTLASLSHTYASAGTYIASIRVKDNSGQSNEWSTTPESCKVKIEVQGEVLTAATVPTALPKAGANTLLTLSYLLSAVSGTALKAFSQKLKKV